MHFRGGGGGSHNNQAISEMKIGIWRRLPEADPLGTVAGDKWGPLGIVAGANPV